MRMRDTRDGVFIGKPSEGDKCVFECERAARVFIWLLIETHGYAAEVTAVDSAPADRCWYRFDLMGSSLRSNGVIV